MRNGERIANGDTSRISPYGGLRQDYTIRVWNMPLETNESDLAELFKPFGKVNRIRMSRDKRTNQFRGFAFVSFQSQQDAQNAIIAVDGYAYHHLILKVEWAK
jgi:translation initiation factor 3 subunit G